jgi:hypothetical protein
MVQLTELESVTSSMSRKRATNYAKAAFKKLFVKINSFFGAFQALSLQVLDLS